MAKREHRPKSALPEDLQREDLAPWEEGEAFAALIDEEGLTQQEVAQAAGKSSAYVGSRVRLAERAGQALRQAYLREDLSLSAMEAVVAKLPREEVTAKECPRCRVILPGEPDECSACGADCSLTLAICADAQAVAAKKLKGRPAHQAAEIVEKVAERYGLGARPVRTSLGFNKVQVREEVIATKTDLTPWRMVQLLHVAARTGDTETVREILDGGADVGASLWDRLTPLHTAAKEGHAEVARLLLERGAEVDAKNKRDDTPLHCAAWGGHTETATVLLERGANIDARGYFGTPLCVAAEAGRTDMVVLLLEQGAGVNVRGYFGAPLHVAAEAGRTDMVVLLLEQGAEVNVRDYGGWTPLYSAVVHDRKETAEVLRKHGGRVPLQFAVGNRWPRIAYACECLFHWGIILLRFFGQRLSKPASLHDAAARGATKALDRLLDNGADVNARGEGYDATPLHSAARAGRVEAIALLLDRGAGIDAVNGEGATALTEAVVFGHAAAAALLIDRGADVNERGCHGMTPLRAAASFGRGDIMKLLLDKGADVTARDEHGVTALDAAAFSGHIEAVELLLDKGADVTARDEHGVTALHAAASRGHIEAVELLLNSGAHVNARSRGGRTPLHLAAGEGMIETAALLLCRGADPNALTKGGVTPMGATYAIDDRKKQKDMIMLLGLSGAMTEVPFIALPPGEKLPPGVRLWPGVKRRGPEPD